MKAKHLFVALVTIICVAACAATRSPLPGAAGGVAGPGNARTGDKGRTKIHPPFKSPNPFCDPPVGPCFEGGRVLANVQVVPLDWGSVDPGVSGWVSSFLGTFLQSSYMGWLSEYDTTANNSARFCSPNVSPGSQSIGPGTSTPPIAVTPPTPGTAVTEDAIVALLKCARAGNCQGPAEPALPTPAADTVYVVYVPQTFTETDSGGDRSCSNFVAYSGHFTDSNGIDVPYAIVFLCQLSGMSIDDEATFYTAAELLDLITNPDPDAPAWDKPNDPAHGFCGGLFPVCETNGPVIFHGYAIPLAWSNANQECYVPCGDAGLPCCDQGPACKGTSTCSQGQCVCGKKGQSCCANLECTDLTVCIDGACVCGGAGQPCCVPDGTCAPGLSCANGHCAAAGKPCTGCSATQTACEAKCGKDATCKCMCSNSYCGCIQGGACGPPHCTFQKCQ